MRFREVYDNPEQHIENLPYENQAGDTETISLYSRRHKSNDDYKRDARFDDVEGILKGFLGQAFKEKTNNPLFQNEMLLGLIEAEIKDNIKHDTKWYELDRLMRQVKDELAKQKLAQASEISSRKGKDSTGDALNADADANRSEATESSTQKQEKQNLPSWDLANWGMTKEQLSKIPVTTKQPDIREALAERYGDVFTTKEVLKIQDRELAQQILMQHGIDAYAKVDVFVVEQEDIENGDFLYGVYMMDKNGRIKQLNMPIREDGDKDIVADRRPQAQFRDKDGNIQTVYSRGKEVKSAVTWELEDGSTLTPYKDKDGKLHLGKAGKGKRFDVVDTVKTEDMINLEESQR